MPTRLLPILKHRYDSQNEPQCWGYVNLQCEVAIEYRFQEAGDFHDGVARVKLDGRLTYIDETGSVILKDLYDWMAQFAVGRGQVSRGGKIGYVDKEGRLAIPCLYDAGTAFSEGLAAVQLGDKWGYVDLDGTERISPRFDDAGGFSEGFAPVKVGDQWSFTDQNGDLATDPRFELAYGFSEGYAAVQLGKKFGFLDKRFSMAVEPSFDAVTSFHEGLASVGKRQNPWSMTSTWHFVDTTGARAIPLEIVDGWGPVFSEGLVARSLTGATWGYSDRSGAVKIDYASFTNKDGKGGYRALMTSTGPFRSGIARVYIKPSYHVDPSRLDEPDNMAYIDLTGKVVAGSLR